MIIPNKHGIKYLVNMVFRLIINSLVGNIPDVEGRNKQYRQWHIILKKYQDWSERKV